MTMNGAEPTLCVCNGKSGSCVGGLGRLPGWCARIRSYPRRTGRQSNAWDGCSDSVKGSPRRGPRFAVPWTGCWDGRWTPPCSKSSEPRVCHHTHAGVVGRAAHPAVLEEFEAALISSDLGVPVAERVMNRLKEALKGTDASQLPHVQNTLRQTLGEALGPAAGRSLA